MMSLDLAIVARARLTGVLLIRQHNLITNARVATAA
jgi:hypothetical protein